jgi:hypothetical protein
MPATELRVGYNAATPPPLLTQAQAVARRDSIRQK